MIADLRQQSLLGADRHVRRAEHGVVVVRLEQNRATIRSDSARDFNTVVRGFASPLSCHLQFTDDIRVGHLASVVLPATNVHTHRFIVEGEPDLCRSCFETTLSDPDANILDLPAGYDSQFVLHQVWRLERKAETLAGTDKLLK